MGPLSVRLPTLLAVAGIAVLLWRLGASSRAGPDPLPALVFLTFGILSQYGRPGEIDLLFTFWVVPYALHGPVLALPDRLVAEVAQRTVDSGGATPCGTPPPTHSSSSGRPPPGRW